VARVEMAPGWEAQVLAAWDKFAAERLGPDIERDAKRYAPVRTGRLRESIEHHLEGHVLVVEAHAPYAAFVELGTRPHLITSHGPWSLRNAGTGQYFGRVVHHPGTRPEPYLRPALYQVRGE
jgi:hypothetical protein